ncbi:hypothetical protein [Streptomyces sp. NPDC002845]
MTTVVTLFSFTPDHAIMRSSPGRAMRVSSSAESQIFISTNFCVEFTTDFGKYAATTIR